MRYETYRGIRNGLNGSGKQLSLSVLTEGVEDEEDWKLAERRSYEIIQVFYVARPMPALHQPGFLVVPYGTFV